MQLEKIIRKIKSQLPEFNLTSRLAQEYKEQIREAQAYLSLIKQLSGSEDQLSWRRLKRVYTSAEELLTRASLDLVNTVSLPIDDEPAAQLTWKALVATRLKDFQIARDLYVFTVSKLRIKKD